MLRIENIVIEGEKKTLCFTEEQWEKNIASFDLSRTTTGASNSFEIPSVWSPCSEFKMSADCPFARFGKDPDRGRCGKGCLVALKEIIGVADEVSFRFDDGRTFWFPYQHGRAKSQIKKAYNFFNEMKSVIEKFEEVKNILEKAARPEAEKAKPAEKTREKTKEKVFDDLENMLKNDFPTKGKWRRR